MSALNDLRLKQRTLRMVFDAEKEREWNELDSDMRNKIETIVYEMYKSGVSVTAIAKDYGTQDRRTIYDIIKKRQKFDDLIGVPDSESTPDLFTVEIASREGGRNIYHVTQDKHEATFYIMPAQGVYEESAWFLDTPADTPLHSELRDNWTTSPIADRVRQMEESHND